MSAAGNVEQVCVPNLGLSMQFCTEVNTLVVVESYREIYT